MPGVVLKICSIVSSHYKPPRMILCFPLGLRKKKCLSHYQPWNVNPKMSDIRDKRRCTLPTKPCPVSLLFDILVAEKELLFVLHAQGSSWRSVTHSSNFCWHLDYPKVWLLRDLTWDTPLNPGLYTERVQYETKEWLCTFKQGQWVQVVPWRHIICKVPQLRKAQRAKSMILYNVTYKG